MKLKKSKQVKRCSPNQQPKKVQSCKMKITGPKLENSDILKNSHGLKTKGGTVASRASNGEGKQKTENNATAERKDRHSHNTEPKVKANTANQLQQRHQRQMKAMVQKLSQEIQGNQLNRKQANRLKLKQEREL